MKEKDIRKLARLLAQHVDDLQMLASTWSEDAIYIYGESTNELRRHALEALSDLVLGAGANTSKAIGILRRIQSLIDKMRADCSEDLLEMLEERLDSLVANEEKFNREWIFSLYSMDGQPKPKVSLLSETTAEKIRKYGIYDGDTVAGIFKSVAMADIERLKRTIGRAIASNSQTTRTMLLEQLERNIATTEKQIAVNMAMVVNGVSNDVCAAICEANPEVVNGVMWITELDDRVCEDCYGYEGMVFDAGEAPTCPLHPNCRCHLVPVTKNFAKAMNDLKGKG